jgi:predicted RNase H-like nuclease (RuvC/YqgF family)
MNCPHKKLEPMNEKTTPEQNVIEAAREVAKIWLTADAKSLDSLIIKLDKALTAYDQKQPDIPDEGKTKEEIYNECLDLNLGYKQIIYHAMQLYADQQSASLTAQLAEKDKMIEELKEEVEHLRKRPRVNDGPLN